MEPMPELKITIYSTEDCTKCKMLKMLLAVRHIDFRDLDATTNWDSVKDLWFMSAPIIKVEKEWEEPIYYWDMETFIKYLDDNGIWVQA